MKKPSGYRHKRHCNFCLEYKTSTRGVLNKICCMESSCIKKAVNFYVLNADENDVPPAFIERGMKEHYAQL